MLLSYGKENPSSIFRIVTLQRKTTRIINTQSRNIQPGSYFKKSIILKFDDKTLIGNIILIIKTINSLLVPNFNNWLKLCTEIQNK